MYLIAIFTCQESVAQWAGWHIGLALIWDLGLDLVNLGLIYDVAVDAAGLCTVTMTLTTMGCPLTDYLHDDITRTVKGVAGINDCKINLTFEPPWTIEMMSRYAKVALGLHG